MNKRILSLVLAIMMMVTMLPLAAFAADKNFDVHFILDGEVVEKGTITVVHTDDETNELSYDGKLGSYCITKEVAENKVKVPEGLALNIADDAKIELNKAEDSKNPKYFDVEVVAVEVPINVTVNYIVEGEEEPIASETITVDKNKYVDNADVKYENTGNYLYMEDIAEKLTLPEGYKLGTDAEKFKMKARTIDIVVEEESYTLKVNYYELIDGKNSHVLTTNGFEIYAKDVTVDENGDMYVAEDLITEAIANGELKFPANYTLVTNENGMFKLSSKERLDMYVEKEIYTLKVNYYELIDGKNSHVLTTNGFEIYAKDVTVDENGDMYVAEDLITEAIANGVLKFPENYKLLLNENGMFKLSSKERLDMYVEKDVVPAVKIQVDATVVYRNKWGIVVGVGETVKVDADAETYPIEDLELPKYVRYMGYQRVSNEGEVKLDKMSAKFLINVPVDFVRPLRK